MSMQFLILGTNQACLSSTWFSQYGLTALATTQTTNFTVCVDTATQFGSCVDQTGLQTFLSKINFGLVRMFLSKGADMLAAYNNLVKRVNKMIQNANKINGNATLSAIVVNSTSARLLESNKNITKSKPNPPNPKSGEKANDTKFVSGSKGIPNKNVKNMNLTTASIQLLTNAYTNLTDFQAFADNYKLASARQKCYSSLLSAETGAICLLTSGAATSYTNGNTTNPTSLSIPQSAAANITTSCVNFIYTRCLIRATRDVMAQVLNITIPAENANITSVCNALAANVGCAKDGSTCSAEIQALIATRLVKIKAEVNDAFENDIDPQNTEDSLNALDDSLNKTLTQGGQTPSRRLQTTGSVDLTVSSNSYDIMGAADNSGLDLSSMEASISTELPTLATSSGTSSGSAFKVIMNLLVSLGLTILMIQQ